MKTKKSICQAQKRQDFIMAAILANCRGCKIEDKLDSTVSEQVENGMSCSLVICDYGKVQELYETFGYLAIKKRTRRKIWLKSCFCGGVSEIQCLVYQQNNVNPFEICKNWIQLNMVIHVIIIFVENMKI